MGSATVRPRTASVLGAAFSWGLAEATFFFIVPDVMLTAMSLSDIRGALKACFATLAGALIGGALMWYWGTIDVNSAVAAFDYIPAISVPMIATVADDLQRQGPVAVFTGPVTGTPYKIYAAQAGAMEMSLPIFLLVSVPARAGRFIFVTLIVAGLSYLIGSRLSLSSKRMILTIFWVVFYAWYFSVMPN